MAISAFRGDRLRGIRKAKGLTLKDVASRAGMDLSQVARYEKGLAEPRATNLEALGTAIDVTTDYLLEKRTAPELPFADAACLQSLERFVRNARLDESAAADLKRVATQHDAAPITVDDWKALVEMFALLRPRDVANQAPQRVTDSGTKLHVLEDLRSTRSRRP